MPSGTHCGMCKRDFVSNKALNAHFKIHRKGYKGGKNGIRHWRIELYETADGFRVVIDGLDHGEANGSSAHATYESAVAKMTVKPWLVSLTGGLIK